jgi:two-component system response regulator HydG
MNPKIYICDDEKASLHALGRTVAAWGFEVETHSSPLTLLASLEKSPGNGDLLLLKLRMPQMDGLEVLQRARAAHPQLGIIVMTGQGSIDSAVEAVRLGACDYLTKPFPEERLSTAFRNCLEPERPAAQHACLKQAIRHHPFPGGIIIQSEPFRQVYEMAQKVALSDVNVVLLGESGTGKELIAGVIHCSSSRAQRRFLAVNCAALTETLLESQLFGHLKGAFTGAVAAHKGMLEEADGGTLLLDEVGELSPALQVKLLRVLQEGEFIPVGATRPREDLYYRLNVIALELPPLRERPEDVEPLLRYFLARAAQKMGRSLREVAPEAVEALRSYPWPGNVRELQNVIERAVILAEGDRVTVKDLPLKVGRPASARGPGAGEAPRTLREAERRQIERILHQTGWIKSRSARILGITRRTLDRKIADFGLHPEERP